MHQRGKRTTSQQYGLPTTFRTPADSGLRGGKNALLAEPFFEAGFSHLAILCHFSAVPKYSVRHAASSWQWHALFEVDVELCILWVEVTDGAVVCGRC
jgi:hypothetical protein